MNQKLNNSTRLYRKAQKQEEPPKKKEATPKADMDSKSQKETKAQTRNGQPSNCSGWVQIDLAECLGDDQVSH